MTADVVFLLDVDNTDQALMPEMTTQVFFVANQARSFFYGTFYKSFVCAKFHQHAVVAMLLPIDAAGTV